MNCKDCNVEIDDLSIHRNLGYCDDCLEKLDTEYQNGLKPFIVLKD